MSKALSLKLKNVLPDETVYDVKKRHIGETGRLAFDEIVIAKLKRIEGIFSYNGHLKSFWCNWIITSSFSLWKTDGSEQNVFLCIDILLKDQESCVINFGETTDYFAFGIDTRHGGSISTLLFILALEILFLLTKTKPKIARRRIVDHCYLYSACADDTFLLKETVSVKHIVDTSHFFSYSSGLKSNLSECEITVIAVLKGVQVVCVV